LQATQSAALKAIYIQEYEGGKNAVFNKARTTEELLGFGLRTQSAC
jgi:hypothetical protein